MHTGSDNLKSAWNKHGKDKYIQIIYIYKKHRGENIIQWYKIHMQFHEQDIFQWKCSWLIFRHYVSLSNINENSGYHVYHVRWRDIHNMKEWNS